MTVNYRELLFGVRVEAQTSMIARKDTGEQEALMVAQLGNGSFGCWTVSSQRPGSRRFARVSRSYSVLRGMNGKHFALCHWKCFPLHFCSREAGEGWGAGAGGRHAPAPEPAPPSAEVGRVLTLGFLVHAQLLILPARTACLLLTHHWDGGHSWPGPLGGVPVACAFRFSGT